MTDLSCLNAATSCGILPGPRLSMLWLRFLEARAGAFGPLNTGGRAGEMGMDELNSAVVLASRLDRLLGGGGAASVAPDTELTRPDPNKGVGSDWPSASSASAMGVGEMLAPPAPPARM